jgi:cation diffusion facilitator family transporter
MPNSLAERSNDKLYTAWLSLVATVVLVAAKLSVGLWTGSLAILSLAAESGIDLVAVLITLLAVRVSSIPPDEDHPYGHGKFDSLSALAQGLLLLGATIWIIAHAASHLFGKPNAVTVNGWSFGVLLFSIALDFWRARALGAAGKEHRSAGLEASSIHFFTDAISALVAALALLLVKLEGWFAADDWAAIVVGLFVGYLSIRIIASAIDGLTDRFTVTGDYERLKSVVQHTSGVEKVTRMRMRTAGPTLFVEVSILLSRVLPLSAIERIVADVEHAIVSEFPNAEATVHWRPVRTASETPFETIKMVIAEHGLLPHNTELSRMADGRIALDYHLEFQPGATLLYAEETSRDIEKRIQEELPQVGRVFVHLEEERSDRALPQIEDAARDELLGRIVSVAKNSSSPVQSVREAHLFRDERDQSIKLVITVDLPSKLSLAEAHEIVTSVENELRKQFPELTRILVQAKPATD